MQWARDIERPMPWRDEKNPYFIWLSEIILQQTRVEQGLPYFLKFKSHYPTVADLANAPQDEVMKLWQGLGYYSRARNLQSAAKYVSNELGGKFPTNFNDLQKLKGVGNYTAAAIASFAYNLPHAVVDGNVYRVLARYFGIHTPIDSTEGKKEFAALAQQMVDTSEPGKYNQAIMDFGAIQCTPANPKCSNCPLVDSCSAFNNQMIELLPVKAKKLIKRTRYLHYLVLRHKGNYLIQQRTAKDIWQQLYEFPLVEADRALTTNELLALLGNDINIAGLSMAGTYKQQLTHQQINAMFYTADIVELNARPSWLSVTKENLNNFAFPKVIDWYLKDNALYFNFP